VFDVLKAAGGTSSAMGRKACKVFLLFFARAKTHMFLCLTNCTLQEVKLFSASGTGFQFSTSSLFILSNSLFGNMVSFYIKGIGGKLQ